MKQIAYMTILATRRRLRFALALSFLLTAGSSAFAQSSTYTVTTPGPNLWSAGTGAAWSVAPIAGGSTSTVLTYGTGNWVANYTTTSINNLAGNYELATLNLTQAAP